MSLLSHIQRLGDRPFLIREARTFTYAELASELAAAEAFLNSTGVRPGDVVALKGRYGFRALAFFLGMAKNRNIVAPLVGADEQGMDFFIDEAGAEWVAGISEPGHHLRDVIRHKTASAHPLVRKLVETKRGGLILFSSGTTGRPKAMLHDLDGLIDSYTVREEPRDLRVLAFMGIDHIGGMDIFLRALASGSTLVAPSERSPETVCRLIQEHAVNVLPATPTFLNLMLLSEAYRGRDLSSLKIVAFGAEAMPPTVLARLKEVFPNVDFQQKFGTSETNAIRTRSKESGSLWMRIDDPNVEARIIHGELWLKSRTRVLGYLNAENDRLSEDGWFRTGDLAEEDGEGFFRITGRVEEIINVGGEKVLPGEIEAFLREQPAVADCRVYGEPNPLTGQAVNAEVVLNGESDPKETIRNLRRHSRQNLAPHKVPVKIHAVEKLEMNERGKRDGRTTNLH